MANPYLIAQLYGEKPSTPSTAPALPVPENGDTNTSKSNSGGEQQPLPRRARRTAPPVQAVGKPASFLSAEKQTDPEKPKLIFKFGNQPKPTKSPAPTNQAPLPSPATAPSQIAPAGIQGNTVPAPSSVTLFPILRPDRQQQLLSVGNDSLDENIDDVDAPTEDDLKYPVQRYLPPPGFYKDNFTIGTSKKWQLGTSRCKFCWSGWHGPECDRSCPIPQCVGIDAHTGELCPRLYCSSSWWKEIGLPHPDTVQIRPNFRELGILIHLKILKKPNFLEDSLEPNLSTPSVLHFYSGRGRPQRCGTDPIDPKTPFETEKRREKTGANTTAMGPLNPVFQQRNTVDGDRDPRRKKAPVLSEAAWASLPSAAITPEIPKLSSLDSPQLSFKQEGSPVMVAPMHPVAATLQTPRESLFTRPALSAGEPLQMLSPSTVIASSVRSATPSLPDFTMANQSMPGFAGRELSSQGFRSDGLRTTPGLAQYRDMEENDAEVRIQRLEDELDGARRANTLKDRELRSKDREIARLNAELERLRGSLGGTQAFGYGSGAKRPRTNDHGM